MKISEQVSLCAEHYNTWKNIALNSTDTRQTRKALERAFFWLELQTAFMAMYTVENINGNDKIVKRKLIIAKTNLAKRLTDYAEEILDEINV